MRILFVMSHAGATRNFESTLRGLADRGHEIHLAFERMQKRSLPGLWDLANSLLDEYPLMTAGEAPKPTAGDEHLISSRMRSSLDYMRYLGPEFSEAPKLQQRAEGWTSPRVRRMATGFPGKSSMRFAFRRAERSIPVSQPVRDYLSEHQPDVVLVTPLLEPRSVQVEYLRAAHEMNIPTCLCVHSWDNLTNKGLVHEVPHAITVWNEMQREEAVTMHRVPADRVVVTGATAYDHWFGWEPSRTREEFADTVGLDPERPFVLYVGSSGFIAPGEADFVVEWMSELRNHGLDDVQVLARPHPTNPMLGSEPSHAALADLDSVHLYPPAGANPTDADSRQDYFDSLYYCSAVTGVNTSAFLEAAILGRPVLTVRAPRYENTQKGMVHFEHLLTAGGGLLHHASTYEEHASQLRDALAARHPVGCVSDRSVNFTEAFIRPFGLDEPATARMVETIEGLPEREAARNLGPTLTGKALLRATRAALGRSRRRAQKTKLRNGLAKASKNATKSTDATAKAERAAAKKSAAKLKRAKAAHARAKQAKEVSARAKVAKSATDAATTSQSTADEQRPAEDQGPDPKVKAT